MTSVNALSDTSRPTVIIDQPKGGSVLSPGPVIVNGRASDTPAWSGIKIVEVRVDGSPYKSAIPASIGDWSTWSTSFNITSSGFHKIKARATDNAGNTDWESVSIEIRSQPVIDTMAPDISITSPSAGTTIEILASGDPLSVKGTSSDIGSGIKVVELRVDDGTFKAATPKSVNDWSTWDVAVPVTTGEHMLVSRATDNAGNQAWNSINVTVTTYAAPVPEPTPAPAPTGDLDQFGIAKLYPTAAGDGNEYYTKTDAATVTEFKDGGRVDRLPSGFSKNPDGSWNIPSGTTPRWVINGGWRNVEMTMQLRINSGTLVQLYSNGEQHTTNVTGAWHGSANKMRTYADGRMGFIKELYHESGNSGYTSEIATKTSGTSITGKWVTVKFVGYNINNASQRKLEAYVSINNDNQFVKVAEYTDSGSWYASTRFDSFISDMKQNYPAYVPENRDTGQDMRRNEVITWQGDWVSFRSDGADYDFKNVSVREIAAGSGPNTQFITNTATMLVPLAQAYVEPAYHSD